MPAELVELPAQVHVVEQLVGELLELRPLLGRHRVEHRLHRGHPPRHLLEQLVEILGVLGEEVAVLLHELFEARILAPFAPLQHLVEPGEHVLHALHVGRRHVLHGAAHLVDHLLHQLLAEPVHQLLEALAGLRRLEVVRLELAHLAGEVVGHQVEPHVALGGGVTSVLLATRIAALLCGSQGVVDGVALLVDDVVELTGDLVVHAAEVVAVEPVLTLTPELLEQLTDPGQLLAVAVAHALVHHPPQCGIDVAVVQQLVGQLVEERVGVEVESTLRAIPPRVGELLRHDRNVALRSSKAHAELPEPKLTARPYHLTACVCLARSSSSTCPGSRTTPRPSATTRPAGS